LHYHEVMVREHWADQIESGAFFLSIEDVDLKVFQWFSQVLVEDTEAFVTHDLHRVLVNLFSILIYIAYFKYVAQSHGGLS
jgi:hypothetical protein